MKFTAVIEVTVEIDARDEKVARRIINANPPSIDLGGAGLAEGVYSMKSSRAVNILYLNKQEENSPPKR